VAHSPGHGNQVLQQAKLRVNACQLTIRLSFPACFLLKASSLSPCRRPAQNHNAVSQAKIADRASTSISQGARCPRAVIEGKQPNMDPDKYKACLQGYKPQCACSHSIVHDLWFSTTDAGPSKIQEGRQLIGLTKLFMSRCIT
jgi:hypothetical protein